MVTVLRMTRRRNVSVRLAAAATAMAIAGPVLAAGFTPGNLVIYRVGNGETLVNTGNAIFLDEYTTTGQFVQTIPLPTTNNGPHSAIFSPGNSSSEGLITLTPDGQYLFFTGYANNTTGQITTTTGQTNGRVIGRIDANGAIDTTTVMTNAELTRNFRSAVSSNGTDIWFTGGNDGGFGIRHTTLGSTTNTLIVPADGENNDWRQVNIYDGQLYLSANESANRFAAVGTGLPTTGPQPLTPLPGVSTNGYQFFLADLSATEAGVDTLYYAEDGGDDGIRKYSLVGGTWLLNGVISVNPNDPSTGNNLRGLTARVLEGTDDVQLFATLGATAGTGSQNLYSVIDTAGHNLSPSTTLATALLNATGAGSFRGIAFVPVAATPALAGDTNDDGVVDLADLNNVLNNFGATGASPGDDNGDGVVDLEDLNRVLNNFGDTAPGSAALSVVPEPSLAAAWLLISGAGLIRRTRRQPRAY